MISKESPNERAKLARTALKKSQDEFGSPMGFNKSNVSAWENERMSVDVVLAQAIELNWGVSWRWIVRGEGSMWVDPVKDRIRENLLPYASSMEDIFISRPLITGAARCGPGGEIEDPGPAASRHALRKEFALTIQKRCGGGKDEDLFYLLCHGQSMERTILDKEIVLLNTHIGGRLEPRNNAIYLVRRAPEDTDARVKRVRLDHEKRQLVLASDNRQYAPMYVDLGDTPLHQVILGRVTWVGRYLLETDPPETDW